MKKRNAPKNLICLWYNKDALTAAVSLNFHFSAFSAQPPS